MSEAKLSPCPFCGNQVESNIAYTASMINCDNQDCIMIGCLIDNKPFVDDIEKKWNNSWVNKEIQKRDAEIERLKKFCSEFVYGEENPEYYSTMDEKIQKRDELLEQAREWITVGEIDCTLAMQVWFKQYEELKR